MAKLLVEKGFDCCSIRSSNKLMDEERDREVRSSDIESGEGATVGKYEVRGSLRQMSVGRS